MKPYQILSIALIVIGCVLLVFGISATQKTGEKVVEEVTGHYTNKTVWYIIGGIALIAGGFIVRRMK